MNKLTFYADGACSRNPGPGGFGVVRISKCYRQTMLEYVESLSLEYKYSEFCKDTTNNREELKAVLHVLQLAKNEPQYKYEIYSDSAYVVNLCNDWMWKWAANGWVRRNKDESKPVENLDLIQQIYDILNFPTFDCKIKKCKGHVGILENELADALASNNQEKFNRLIKENCILV